MTYGKTPFQSITNQISKLHAIIDPSHMIDFPDISEKDLLDVLKVGNQRLTMLDTFTNDKMNQQGFYLTGGKIR